MRALMGMTGVLAVAVSAMAGSPTFTKAPAAAVGDDGVTITFAVNRATDVAVTIRGKDGKPVCHLAAGVLGDNAPKPLAPKRLSQTLAWDFRDDAGRRVPAGAYTVEVALGLAPALDRVMGHERGVLGTVHGLAVGPKGRLYVMAEVGRDTREPRILILEPDGAYVRTLCPRPAGLPLERVKPLGELVLNDGTRIPRSLLPEHGARHYQQPLVMPNGDLVFLSARSVGHNLGHRYYSVGEKETRPRRLLRLAPDGGASDAGYLGPILGKGFEKGTLFLALAPDGETIYVSGARHAVFRTRWPAKTSEVSEASEVLVAPFVGTPDRPGAAGAALKDPQGIAVDRKGNLYVADRGNHRVAVFSPAGKPLGAIPIEWPQRVLVHPRTGAIYVSAGYRRQTLHKFTSLKGRKPVAGLDLRATHPMLALDARDGKTNIFAANVGARAGGQVLVRIADGGSDLRVTTELSDPGPMFQPRLLGVDRQRELVYGMAGAFGPYMRVDGRSTGVPETVSNPLHPKANGISELSTGPTGITVFHVQGEMGRLDHALRPLPFRETGSHIALLPRDDCPRSFYDRGSCVAPNGDIYWVHERGGYAKPMVVTVLGADGRIRKDPLITFESRSPASIRVDREGNVYVIDHLKPLGRILPEAFEGKVTVTRTNRFVYNYGSLVKFRPAGGAIRELARGRAPATAPNDGKPHYTTAEGRGHFVGEGVVWSYYGASMIQPALDRVGCMCWHPRFDLDGFARAFVPDQLRCRVVVLDANGNVITTFGRYGNVDNDGIALADPRTVMVSDAAAYVGDMINNRVLRVALKYATTAALEVTAPAPERSADLAAIERRFGKTDPGAAERKDLIVAAAALRLKPVKAEVVTAGPSLAKGLDWDQALNILTARDVLPSTADAERAVCLAVRDVAGWPESEARAVMGRFLGHKDQAVRSAAVTTLWNGCAGDATVPLLKQALADKSEIVRVNAANALLALDNPAGLAVIFTAARSADRDVFALAEEAMLNKVTVWDPDHPKARLIDPTKAIVPRYPIGKAEVRALLPLLESDRWYLRRAALFMLGVSDQPAEVGPVLVDRLPKETNRNLNRTIGSLGVLRYRPAVPALLKYMQRGRCANYGTLSYNGDKAEQFAATALVRIGDPAAVGPIIGLMASRRPTVPALARRTLSRFFDPDVAGDRELVPKDGRLAAVRVDDLPDLATHQAAWQAFWKVNNDNYVRNPDGYGLKRKP